MTTKRIIFFLGILFLGIIGLVIADQIDFTHGRRGASVIGNGTPDPLVSGTVSPRSYIQPGTTKSTQNSIKPQPSGVDGIKKAN